MKKADINICDDGFLVNNILVEAQFSLEYKFPTDEVEKIVITIDEEFNIGKTKEVEEVIRHIAENVKYTTYIDDQRFNDDEFDPNDFCLFNKDVIKIKQGHKLFETIVRLKKNKSI